MPLTAPTGLSLTKLTRSVTTFGEYYSYSAKIEWTNSEAANHFVEVALSCPQGLGQGVAPVTTLARGANNILNLELARFFPGETFVEKNVTVSVTVKSSTESSAAVTVEQQLLLSPTEVVPNAALAYNGAGAIDFATNWTGVVESQSQNTVGVLELFDLSSGRIVFIGPLFRIEERRNLNLIDGRFYRATVTYLSAKTPQRSGLSFSKNNFDPVFSSVVFEYYKNGPSVPKFTSDLSATAYIDTDFSYTITADDTRSTFAVSLGSATGLTFDGANKITGTFASTGNYNIGLVATNSFGTAAETLGIEVRPFTAFGGEATVIRNAAARLPLAATHRATWAINSGAPQGFSIGYEPPNFGTATGPESAFLTGSPAATGSFNISLTATRAGFPAQTSTSSFALTVADSLPATIINANADILRNGIVAEVGQNISLALASVPAPAVWFAEGLPPGLAISQNGTISGAATQQGTFFAAITARAAGREVSAAVNIRFEIRPAAVAPQTGATAAQRSPWLNAQWELTDLHVLARSRVVQSTLFESGALRLKLGDAINFAIFFVDQNSAVFALGPSQLRITIRRADNLDDLIIFKSSTPPATATTQSQTYYLLPVTTGNREREVALEWAEENGKNEPLQCVADIDWVKDGKTYSSRSFPVLLELDVTRP
jgi:hypothetical protein